MSKQDTQTALPKLRFPEFRDSEGWKEKPLGKMLKIGNGKDYKHLSKGDYPVYGTGGYMLSVDDYLHDGESVCIGRKGTIDKPFFLDEKFWTVDTLFYTHSFKDCLPRFIYLIFQNIEWKNYNAASGVPSLSKATIEKIDVFSPDVPEQQKIADCLSSVDELIAHEGQKLEALQDHKKGLMQQLFPAEGEARPALRFPEFQNAPEWEETMLGQHCKITTGKLDANAMVEDGQYRFYTCAREHYHIDNYAFDTDALLISGNGANVGYIHHYKGKFNAYQRTYVLDQFQEDIVFVKYFLERNLKKRIDEEKKDGNTPYIVMAALTEMEMRLPSYEEQQRIADCLSSVDSLITAQSQKIEALQEHKKGLMQQLFPSSEEVMG